MSQSDERVAREQVQKLLGELGKLQADPLNEGMLQINPPDTEAIEALQSHYHAAPEFLEFVKTVGELHCWANHGFSWYTPKPVSKWPSNSGQGWYVDEGDQAILPDYFLCFAEDGGEGIVYFFDSRTSPWEILVADFIELIYDRDLLKKTIAAGGQPGQNPWVTYPEVLAALAEIARDEIVSTSEPANG